MASFAPFTAGIKDPVWISARTESGVNDPIVTKTPSVLIDAARFPGQKWRYCARVPGLLAALAERITSAK